MRFKLWLAVGALLWWTPHAMPAQGSLPDARTQFAEMATRTLGQAQRIWAQRAFLPVGQPMLGVLSAGERDSLAIPLEPGAQYVVLGMCDEDCRALGLALFDQSGRPGADESQTDTHPFLQVAQAEPATYRLEVFMKKCSTPPCYYGVQLLRKQVRPSP